MAKGRKIKEVEQLISMGGEKGFLAFDEVNGIPPNDIVSSDQIDDVLMMFDEMDIDVVDDLQGLKEEEEKSLEKEEDEGDELDIGAFGKATDPYGCISGRWGRSLFSHGKEKLRSQRGLRAGKERCSVLS